MKRVFWALVLLTSVTLACGQYVGTPTPTQPTPTPAPATLATQPTATLTATPPPTADAVSTAFVRQPIVIVRDAADGVPTGDYLKAGQEVSILEIDGDWVHIAEPAGWVFIGCLDGLSDKRCEAK